MICASNRLRIFLWSFIGVVIIFLCALYGHFTTDFNVAGIERTVLAASLGVLGVAAVFVAPRFNTRKTEVFLILLLCLVSRAALLPAAPSDDINRYLWEGKLTAQGVSPYQGLAEDDSYVQHRDQYWVKMNHTDKPTAYPPLAMQIFRGINSFGYSPMSYKIVFLVVDLVIVGLLLGLLAHYQRPLRWVLFYGLSPLTLLSFSAEGHFDVVMILAFVVALLAFSKRWFIICGIAVGIAVGVKLMAAVIAPILLWKTGWKGIGAGLVSLFLPLGFYWNDLTSVLHALFVFGSGGGFNGPVHSLLTWLLDSSHSASVAVALLYIGCWFIAFWMMLRGQLWSALLVAFGGLLVLSPIIHFWYLTWVLPLVVLRPKLSWISLSVTFSLYLLVWHNEQTIGQWSLPLWAKWMFWLPFAVILICEIRRGLPRLFKAVKRNEKITWSIVIPTYQAASEQLDATLLSIANQSLKPKEVIISNAGDTPGFKSLGLPIEVIDSELGRGQQIKTGAEAAKQSWVLVVHSDLVLAPDALEHLTSALLADEQIIAGSLGQRFNHTSPGLLLVEAMNEFRATAMHTSFGDQSQFFHRKSAVDYGALTKQKLMEDVEMSDRFNAIGETLYLGNEGVVSAQKWIKHSFSRRFFTIIGFMLRYRLCFSKPAREALCEKFYKRYYG